MLFLYLMFLVLTHIAADIFKTTIQFYTAIQKNVLTLLLALQSTM